MHLKIHSTIRLFHTKSMYTQHTFEAVNTANNALLTYHIYD